MLHDFVSLKYMYRCTMTYIPSPVPNLTSVPLTAFVESILLDTEAPLISLETKPVLVCSEVVCSEGVCSEGVFGDKVVVGDEVVVKADNSMQ